MTFESIRLSSRQYRMLHQIEIIHCDLEQIRKFNQTTLKSLVQRNFVSVGPRSAHITVQGRRAYLSFQKVEIYRKIASDKLFSGFNEYLRKRA